MGTHLFVTYFRVSTKRQERSGLGIDAQREAVMRHLARVGGEQVGAFTEVESGRVDSRPQLNAAIQRAKVTGATLLVAKLDRLSRNAAFLLTLRDAGVGFVAADMPEANTLTVGLLAVMAQHEREMISMRTREALAAARRRGVRLGNPQWQRNLVANGDGRASAALKARAMERAEALRSEIADIQAGGIETLSSIAEALNQRRVRTARGGKWRANSVGNVLRRLAAAQ